MAEALACRYSGKAPSDPAREFMGAPVSELARECLQAAGIRIPRQPSEIIRLAAMQTADFPGLLTGTGQRLLLDAYAAATPAIKLVARRSTVTDFRTKYILRLGEAPSLLKITEANPEIQHGLRAEVKESYRAYTYARIFPITREALINDDLSAFADFVRAFGIAAATLEGTLLSDLLVSNPTMSDTYALFATEHSNLNSGAGSAFGTSGLSAARKGMRLQTGIDGTTVLDIPPAFVVGPAALETSIESVLTAITYPATPTDANVFLNRLKPVIVPYLFTAS
jgi:hypothetical protein